MAKQTQTRAWQRMLSGRRLDLLDPSPLDVEIEDIAHGLARVARWNGQTKGAHAFSVAQHCVLVERLTTELNPRLTREARLMALLHDAPEYVIGDLISPFKAAVGIDYKDFELKIPVGHPSALRPAGAGSGGHDRALQAGRHRLGLLRGDAACGVSTAVEAKRYFGTPSKALRTPRLVPLSAADAQALFLERFKRLAI